MGERRAILIALLFCFCLLVSTSGIVLASSGNWVELAKFTEENPLFTCDYVEWRVRWKFDAPEPSTFTMWLYDMADGEPSIDSIIKALHKTGMDERSGVWSFNRQGTFYIAINTINVRSYELIIEQNLDSIPEFPSLIILPLFLAATLFTITFKKELFHQQ